MSERYGIAARAAAEAVLEHRLDGARLRPASDAFLLSRIARAVVDALDEHAREAAEAAQASREAWERNNGPVDEPRGPLWDGDL
jgi:hypothetical protein